MSRPVNGWGCGPYSSQSSQSLHPYFDMLKKTQEMGSLWTALFVQLILERYDPWILTCQSTSSSTDRRQEPRSKALKPWRNLIDWICHPSQFECLEKNICAMTFWWPFDVFEIARHVAFFKNTRQLYPAVLFPCTSVWSFVKQDVQSQR